MGELGVEWFLLVLLVFSIPTYILGSPCGSAGKESICNTGDPGSIPGSGSSPGEGMDYPLQYFWTSLMAQMVKNLPAI